MTAPSLPVDASLPEWSNDVYFVVEAGAIWRTLNLSEAGAATWEKVFDASTEFTEGTWETFTRVICSSVENLIYALGVAQKTGQSGDDYTVYCFRSANNGETWNYYEVGAIEKVESWYTLTGTCTYDPAGYTWPITYTFTKLSSTKYHFRCVAGYKYPFTYAAGGFYVQISGAHDNLPHLLRTQITWSSRQDHYQAPVGLQWQASTTLNPVDEGSGIYYYHPINTSMIQLQNFKYEIRLDVEGYTCEYILEIVEVDGVPVSSDSDWPCGFDVARTNANWLYVGFADKIVASEDGGYTWFDFYTFLSVGANDICVDPQLAGAIYYWSTGGDLNLLVKQTLGELGVLTSSVLMTETPLRIPLRIARDPSSGRLLAIPNGTILKMRNLAVTTNLKTGLVEGRGLHVYPGQKMIMVDVNNIWISDNIQAGTPTITAKKGLWSTYGIGINAHRMAAP